jgi:hypothetical protein
MNETLQFASLHAAANTWGVPLVVPANATYTIENVYIQNQNIGGLGMLVCGGGEPIAMLRTQVDQLYYQQFSNLNAVVGGGANGANCVFETSSMATGTESYIQVQYYDFDVNAAASPRYELYYNAAALLWLSFLILSAGVFFGVAYFFYKRFNR